VQHEHLRAALGLVHVGGADDHAQLLVIDQLLHDLPQIAPRQRIDAHAGFVQQQQIGERTSVQASPASASCRPTACRPGVR
jgi:hypothetical protein